MLLSSNIKKVLFSSLTVRAQPVPHSLVCNFVFGRGVKYCCRQWWDLFFSSVAKRGHYEQPAIERATHWHVQFVMAQKSSVRLTSKQNDSLWKYKVGSSTVWEFRQQRPVQGWSLRLPHSNVRDISRSCGVLLSSFINSPQGWVFRNMSRSVLVNLRIKWGSS